MLVSLHFSIVLFNFLLFYFCSIVYFIFVFISQLFRLSIIYLIRFSLFSNFFCLIFVSFHRLLQRKNNRWHLFFFYKTLFFFRYSEKWARTNRRRRRTTTCSRWRVRRVWKSSRKLKKWKWIWKIWRQWVFLTRFDYLR